MSVDAEVVNLDIRELREVLAQVDYVLELAPSLYDPFARWQSTQDFETFEDYTDSIRKMIRDAREAIRAVTPPCPAEAKASTSSLPLGWTI